MEPIRSRDQPVSSPLAGTCLFGSMFLYKINSSTNARMRGRHLRHHGRNFRGTRLGAHWLITMTFLAKADTVELQRYIWAADGYFSADHTTFWWCKVG